MDRDGAECAHKMGIALERAEAITEVARGDPQAALRIIPIDPAASAVRGLSDIRGQF